MKIPKLPKSIPPILLLIGFLVIWHILSQWKSDLFVPICSILVSMFDKNLLISALNTLMEGFCGLVVGTLIAFPTVCLGYLVRPVQAAVIPWALMLQAMPAIVFIPFIIVFIGYGFTARAAVATLLCVWLLIINFNNGMSNIPQEAVDLFRVWHASRFQELINLRLPFSKYSLIPTLRLGAALAIVGSIVGGTFMPADEKTNLGAWIFLLMIKIEYAKAYAGIVATAIVSLTFVGLINFSYHVLSLFSNSRLTTE